MSATTTETVTGAEPSDGAAAPVRPHRPVPRRGRRIGLARWSLRRILLATGAAVTILLVAALAVGGAGLNALTQARGELVDELDPALLAAQQLDAAGIDQETGVRGFALSARPDFLEPYVQGRADEVRLLAELRTLVASRPGALADLDAVAAASQRWRARYAEPTIAAVQQGTPPPPAELGKGDFDVLRGALDVQRSRLLALRDDARDDFDAATQRLLLGVGTVVVLGLATVALLAWLRRVVVVPTRRLAGEVRKVADGDLDHTVVVVGPREIAELAEDVDAMRRLIVHELATSENDRRELDARSEELARSNSDLEQFAYVASHDLQEPLRKVASFCQLLQRRYAGEIDERADQYIAFAVDGAKRMQVLINDLLSFSRVGRQGGTAEVVDLDGLVDRAVENVAGALEESGGTVERGELPSVLGEPVLLTTVFQNLMSNSLKFRGDAAPHVRVDAERDDDRWLLRFADNGIGISYEYAERIFVIFQRLHARNAYPGTGIGLSMCRKIVEHHGGTMWLEENSGPGTVFVIALPALPAPDPAAGPDPAGLATGPDPEDAP